MASSGDPRASSDEEGVDSGEPQASILSSSDRTSPPPAEDSQRAADLTVDDSVTIISSEDVSTATIPTDVEQNLVLAGDEGARAVEGGREEGGRTAGDERRAAGVGGASPAGASGDAPVQTHEEGSGSGVFDPESTRVDRVESHGNIGGDQSIADVRVSTMFAQSVSIPIDLDLNVSISEIEMTVGGVDCLVDQRAVEGAVVGEVEVPQEVMSAVLGGDTPVGRDLPPTSVPESVVEPGDVEMEDLVATGDSDSEGRDSGGLR